MAVETKEEREKRIHEATSIKGAMPSPGKVSSDRSKWDEKGNLIDPALVKSEKRQRDIALGKVKPEIEDYHDQAFGKRIMNVPEAPVPSKIEEKAAAKEAREADKEASKPLPPPESLASLTPPPQVIPKPEPPEEADPDA